jgi:YafQ family addiction module toxin component
METRITDKLASKIKKLSKKDKATYSALINKMEEISKSTSETIEHYKNLRHSLSNLKRVHINKCFVLTFTYIKNKEFILFDDFDHHNKIYRRK